MKRIANQGLVNYAEWEDDISKSVINKDGTDEIQTITYKSSGTIARRYRRERFKGAPWLSDWFTNKEEMECKR